MHGDWITSSTGRHVLAYWADPRPAWLWSKDGDTLLWRNPAARFVRARLKKNGLKLTAEAVPIRGQVLRLIRLGRVGVSSLARIQFLVGEKPLAMTCACTPVDLPGGDIGLLLVGDEKVDKDVREAASDLGPDRLTEALIPEGSDYLLVVDGAVRAGSAGALASEAPRLPHQGLPAESETVAVIAAGPKAQTLLVFRPAEAPAPIAEAPAAPSTALSGLFDRLADDAQLFSSLSAADEVFAGPPPVLPEPVSAADLAATEQLLAPDPAPSDIATIRAEEDEAPEDSPSLFSEPEPDLADMPEIILPVVAEAVVPAETPAAPEAPAPEPAEPAPPAQQEQPRSHWLITGRGFRAVAPPAPPPEEPAPAEPANPAPATIDTVDAATDAEAVERVTRYNFEELGRILTDRVAGDTREPAPPPVRQSEGVVSLSAETLVLNRLQLAILVFRDQQVLFANRALTDLLAYDSVESLRGSGIAAIFPSADDTASGPVNQLVRSDGTLLPVSARLQSVSWQGRPALMLSALPVDNPRGHEGAVRAFAQLAADASSDGFLAADRSGLVTEASPAAAAALGRTPADLIGKPLAILVGPADLDALRTFLEKPARFAETARPHVTLGTEDGSGRLTLFAEGQAGKVTGYFGTLRTASATAPATPPPPDTENVGSLLARLSRGLRRPLNTIIGFADLIRTADFGSTTRERYLEYADDIRTAGLEITVLADELDDYTRLSDPGAAPRQSELDLQGLLENCALRVKGLAGAARVLVRTAIAERLPLIRADRASLAQALLNLLASAIDTTPVGGSVILSAQYDDDGNIAVHVRDGAQSLADVAERFVVFRDGVDRQGEPLEPVKSAMGLALTRSLLAVNSCKLAIDPTAGVGTLFTLSIPAALIVRNAS